MENISVYDKILKKGEEAANEILRLGQEKAKAITLQLMKETDQKIAKMIIENNYKNADLVTTKKAELEQVKKQKVLTNRKRIINETFKKALIELKLIKDDSLVKLVIKLLKQEELLGNEVLRVNENEYSRYQKLFSSKKNDNLDILSKNISKEFHLTLKTYDGNISGGFILEGNYYDINYSYEQIILESKKNLETEVAKMLFGD